MIQTVVIPVLVVVVLVVVNGLFVAAEFALVGARPSRLEHLADNGNRAARRLLVLIDRPTGKDGYIAIAQLGITLASIGLGMYGEPAVAGWLYGPFEDWGLSHASAHTVGFIVALSGITFLHVVLGEMIPKALALQAPEAVTVKVDPFMRTFGLLFRPMVAVLNYAALGLMRLLRIPEPDPSMSLYTSSELAFVTDEAADSGQIGAMQRELIRNLFELDNRTAGELMTSRGRVEAIDIHADLGEVASRIEGSPRSRYPLVDGGLDHPVGVLHIKDYIRATQNPGPLDLGELARPLPTVVASTSAEDLLDRFKRERTHIAMVIDEFGSTLGVVTLDDIVAEVLEEPGEVDKTVAHEDGSVSLDGETTLAELRSDHGIDLFHPDVATVAGLVLLVHGSVPEVDTAVRYGDQVLAVEAVDGRQITRVRIRS